MGKPVDEKRLKAQWRAAARAYHPDVGGEGSETREQFDAAREAYEALSRYNDELRGDD